MNGPKSLIINFANPTQIFKSFGHNLKLWIRKLRVKFEKWTIFGIFTKILRCWWFKMYDMQHKKFANLQLIRTQKDVGKKRDREQTVWKTAIQIKDSDFWSELFSVKLSFQLLFNQLKFSHHNTEQVKLERTRREKTRKAKTREEKTKITKPRMAKIKKAKKEETRRETRKINSF